MAYIIEMGKFPCIKCSRELWFFPKSQEEINTLQCDDCKSIIIEQIEEKENITSSNPKEEENSTEEEKQPE